MPREPVFTTVGAAFVLVAANAGISSQENADLTTELESRLAAASRNVTAVRVWINGLYFTQAAVTTPVVSEYSMGVYVAPSRTDDGDFPNVGNHEGSPMLHEARRLVDLASTASITTLHPQSAGDNNGSSVRLTTRAKRKLQRTDDHLFLVLQKSLATEENIQFTCSVTVMWLLP